MKKVLAMFDWDGTLADTTRVSYQAVCATFRHWNLIPPPFDVFFAKISNDPTSIYHRHGIPKSVTRTELKKIWDDYLRENVDSFVLREGVREVLLFCRNQGIKTAIVSANTEEFITRGMRRFAIDHLIDHMVCDAYDKAEKLKCVRTRFEAYRAFYVGDTYMDLRAAKAVDIMAVGITGGFEPPSRILLAKPDHLISSFGELFTILHHEMRSANGNGSHA